MDPEALEPAHDELAPVQLRDYLQQRRAWLLLVLILPIIFGGAAYAYVHAKPKQYLGTVQVAVPQIYTSSDSTIGLYIANFGQALLRPDLQTAVSKATRVSTDDLASLGAARVNLSSAMEVDLSSTSSVPATRAALVAAVKAARLKVASQGLSLAQATVTQAQQSTDKATAALTTYQDSIGNLSPAQIYLTTQASIRTAQDNRVQAVADGNPARAAALTTQIQTLQAQLATLSPQVRQVAALTSALTSANTSLHDAQQTLGDKQDLVTTAGNDNALSSITSDPVSPVVRTVEYVGLGVAAGVLLALAVIVVPDLLRRPDKRRWRARRPDDQEPADVLEPADQPEPADVPEPARVASRS